MIFLDNVLTSGYNSEGLVNSLMGQGLVDTYMIAAATKMCAIASGLATCFFFINLGWNYFKTTSTKGAEGKFFNFGDLVTSFMFIIMIGAYIPVMSGLLVSISFINKATVLTGAEKEAYVENLNKLLGEQAQKNYEENGEPEPGSIISYAEMLITSPLMALELLVNAGARLSASVVSLIVGCVAKAVVSVLFIIGPLAIAVSMLPWFSDKLMDWFGTILNAAFVFTTMNILDMVLLLEQKAILASWSNGSVVGVGHILAMNISIIVMYCLSFWLTSKFIGSDSAGKVLSTAVGAVTTAAGMLAGSVAPAMKAAAGSASSDAANTAQQGMDIN